MYRRLGSKHLFQKLDGSSSLPGCDLAKMIRKHPLLVLLSVLCKSLQRSLIFIALPFLGVCFVRKSGCKGTAFFNTLQMFRKKSLRKLIVFRVILQNKGKKRAFMGKRQGTGDILGTRPPCHGGGLRGKTEPYRGKTKPWRGRNKGRRTEKMGRDERKQESLTTGKLFSPYFIYSAGKAKVAVAGKSTPSCPLGRAKTHRPSFGMVSGWVRDGKPHANKQISHASQATGRPHSNRLKSGVKNEVNFVAL